MFKTIKHCLYDNIKVSPWLYLDEQIDIVGNDLILTIVMHAKIKYSV